LRRCDNSALIFPDITLTSKLVRVFLRLPTNDVKQHGLQPFNS
jgi:hypothetical protein